MYDLGAKIAVYVYVGNEETLFKRLVHDRRGGVSCGCDPIRFPRHPDKSAHSLMAAMYTSRHPTSDTVG